MELLLVIPLAAAAVALYWLFKPPHSADHPSEIPELAPVMSMDKENAPGQVATVHAASALMKKSTGE